MTGKRYSKEDLRQINLLIQEGFTDREIAERLGRNESGIKNLRYRKRLVKKAEDETKILFKRRDELCEAVETLRGQQDDLTREIEKLREERQRLEDLIAVDENLLQAALTQALTNLKFQRPELFCLSGEEQLIVLAKLFFEIGRR